MQGVITYDQRRSRIKTIEDIDIEIKRAKQYARTLRAKAKRFDGTLSEKVALNEKANEAEKVFREIRMKSWDIEDELLEL